MNVKGGVDEDYIASKAMSDFGSIFSVNPLSENSSFFYDPQEARFLKMLLEKEKMLVTSIVSFSHNILQPVAKY